MSVIFIILLFIFICVCYERNKAKPMINVCYFIKANLCKSVIGMKLAVFVLTLKYSFSGFKSTSHCNILTVTVTL